MTCDICGEFFRGFSSDRSWRECQPERRHTLFECFIVYEVFQGVDDDTYCRYFEIALDFCDMADDRRRACASMANGHDHQAIDGLDLLPEVGIIGGVCSLFHPKYRLHLWHVHVHPFLHLLQKLIAAIERD